MVITVTNLSLGEDGSSCSPPAEAGRGPGGRRRRRGQVPEEVRAGLPGRVRRSDPPRQVVEGGGEAGPGSVFRGSGPEDIADLVAGRRLFGRRKKKQEERGLVGIRKRKGKGAVRQTEDGRSQESKGEVGVPLCRHGGSRSDFRHSSTPLVFQKVGSPRLGRIPDQVSIGGIDRIRTGLEDGADPSPIRGYGSDRTI